MENKSEIELFDLFAAKLRLRTERKASLYNGVNRDLSYDCGVRFAREGLCEIVSALACERFELAKAECLDLAHSAFLIYLTLNKKDG